MTSNDFSDVKTSIFSYFETKVSKSDLFKTRVKINKKQKEIDTCKDHELAKKEEELKELEAILHSFRKEALITDIPNWLTQCAEKAQKEAKPMFKVTHPAKFTNGLIAYGGILNVANPDQSNCYLTTDALPTPNFDIVNSNGNLISHGRFMMAKIGDMTVYEKLERGDDTWLFEFSTDKKQVEQWQSGLANWVGIPDLPETSRLKQTYFPMPDGTYHLTAPLFSSSMCQHVYDKIRETKFSRENSNRRKAKKNHKYHDGILVEFPAIATMNFGGAQPQNISIGNFERRGEAFLLPCSPPNWLSSIRPPINTDSLFKDEFDRRAWKLTKELQAFLVKLHQQQGNRRIRNRVKYVVNQLIDTLLNYAAEIQSLSNSAGWSENALRLKPSHKLWLDPHRQDKQFQDQRKSGEWQTELCNDFGLWLNKKLENKGMVFEKIESSHWAKLLKKQLREFERDLEVQA